MVGTHIIKSLKDFHVDPVLSPEQKAALKGTYSVCVNMQPFVCFSHVHICVWCIVLTVSLLRVIQNSFHTAAMKASTPTPTQSPAQSLKDGEVAVQIDEDPGDAIDVSGFTSNDIELCK